MAYIEAPPSPALRRWIECFWWRGGMSSRAESRDLGGRGAASLATRPDASTDARDDITVLPDGAADIIFDLSPRPSELTSAFAVGTMTAPLVVEPDAREFVGVRFRPGCAARFLGIPLRELT